MTSQLLELLELLDAEIETATWRLDQLQGARSSLGALLNGHEAPPRHAGGHGG